MKEADLTLVYHPIGNKPARGFSEDVLGAETMYLETGRNASAQLDELVVEEGNTDLERVRHRRSIEVVQHVVDEAQLRVDVERLRGSGSSGAPVDPSGAGAVPPGRPALPSVPYEDCSQIGIHSVPSAIVRKRSTVLSAARVDIARRTRRGPTEASRSAIA